MKQIIEYRSKAKLQILWIHNDGRMSESEITLDFTQNQTC